MARAMLLVSLVGVAACRQELGGGRFGSASDTSESQRRRHRSRDRRKYRLQQITNSDQEFVLGTPEFTARQVFHLHLISQGRRW